MTPIDSSLNPMDYVRGALLNGLHSGLTLDDVCRMAANADSPEAFDRAVNMLASVTIPDSNHVNSKIQVSIADAEKMVSSAVSVAISKITPAQWAQICSAAQKTKGKAPNA